MGFGKVKFFAFAQGLPHFEQSDVLQLPDALPGHAELLPDFLKGALPATIQSEAEGDDLALARVKDIE